MTSFMALNWPEKYTTHPGLTNLRPFINRLVTHMTLPPEDLREMHQAAGREADYAEEQYFYHEMAWCEMLTAIELHHAEAQASKCPVALSFHARAQKIAKDICNLQTDIRAQAAGEFKGETK